MTNFLEQIERLVGVKNVLVGAGDRGERPWNTHQPFLGKALVRPENTQQVSDLLKLCNAQGQSVVPFGGLTNLVRACVTTPSDIALSFENMKAIEDVNATELTMTVEAGATLQELQQAAESAGLFFPVDIGSKDSCEAGGIVSTNAGGTKVIRYGMTREAVLGLEAVLADGTIVSSMNRYIKNNSGFDLKHLFIGSEGVLGVITKVVFKLDVKPLSHNVALLAVDSYSQVLEVLAESRRHLGSMLCGFEVMWDSFYCKATQPEGRHKSPFDRQHAIYIIIEAMGTQVESDTTQFLSLLEILMENELVVDGVMANSDRERDEIWAIRGEVEWLVRDAQNFDVSLRSGDVETYIRDIETAIHTDLPSALVATFGHLGDNNLHIAVLAGGDGDSDRKAVEAHIYNSLLPYQGAISAEHGIGLEKKPFLAITRSASEIALMRALKQTVDPNNILNPGKVI